jgi:DNA repair exonuclease SbcCD nuclease subunit
MKVAQISDVHIDYYATRLGAMRLENGINVYHKERVALFQQMISKVVAAKVDVIVISGDLHNKNKPAPQEYADVFNVLDSVPNHIPVLVIPGNHDETTSRGCALQPLMGRRPHMLVALEPQVVKWQGFNFMLMPWGTPIDVVKEWCTQANNAPKILVYHTGVMDGNLNWGETADEAATCNLVALEGLGCEAAMLGHYHGQGPLDIQRKIWYAGSPECFNFGEAEQPKGYLIWEFNEKSLVATCPQTNDGTPKYLTLTAQEILECPPELAFGYLRIRGEVSENERMRIIQFMKTLKCEGYKLDLTSKEKAQRVIQVAGRTNKEILGNYFTSKKITEVSPYFEVDDEIEKEIAGE